MAGLNVKKIKKDFPILRRKVNGKPLVYLDNFATTQKPKQVIEVEKKYYETINANIHRGLNSLSIEATEAYEHAHEAVAKFIGTESMEEIVFLKNATEGLNLAAVCLSRTFLQPGDEILLTKMEHHASLVPWLILAKEKGYKLNYIDLNKDGTLKTEQYAEKISRNTKVVAVTQTSNVLGTINPVKEIVKAAHDNGSFAIVDAASSAPHMKINVKELDADFLAFSGHKMLAPTGTGVLYGKAELLEKLEPFLGGGDMISEVRLDGASWNKLPWKFEAGTPNIAGGIALGTAVEYLQKLGMENVREHEKSLVKHALKVLFEVPEISIYGPAAEKRAGVVSFNINDIHPHDIATVLDQSGIEIRAGDHCAQPLMRELGIIGAARASLYIYNSKDEIDKLKQALLKARKIFEGL